MNKLEMIKKINELYTRNEIIEMFLECEWAMMVDYESLCFSDNDEDEFEYLAGRANTVDKSAHDAMYIRLDEEPDGTHVLRGYDDCDYEEGLVELLEEAFEKLLVITDEKSISKSDSVMINSIEHFLRSENPELFENRK